MVGWWAQRGETVSHSTPPWEHDPSIRLKRKERAERNLRDLSCRLRCSLRLNARLQNWHLYFFSGVLVAFFGVEAEADDAVAAAEAGIVRSLRVARMQAVVDQREPRLREADKRLPGASGKMMKRWRRAKGKCFDHAGVTIRRRRLFRRKETRLADD